MVSGYGVSGSPKRLVEQLLKHLFGKVFMDHAIDFDHGSLVAGSKTVPAPKIGLIFKLMRLKILFDLLNKLLVAAGKAGTTEANPYLYQFIFLFLYAMQKYNICSANKILLFF
jgi:hypothetical protein